jgi:adenylosuccinate lyase
MKAWNQTDGSFKKNLLADEHVTAVLSAAEIESCFDPNHYLRNLNQVFERVGI